MQVTTLGQGYTQSSVEIAHIYRYNLNEMLTVLYLSYEQILQNMEERGINSCRGRSRKSRCHSTSALKTKNSKKDNLGRVSEFKISQRNKNTNHLPQSPYALLSCLRYCPGIMRFTS